MSHYEPTVEESVDDGLEWAGSLSPALGATQSRAASTGLNAAHLPPEPEGPPEVVLADQERMDGELDVMHQQFMDLREKQPVGLDPDTGLVPEGVESE